MSDEKKFNPPTEQEIKLYRFVAERIRKKLIGTNADAPFIDAVTRECKICVNDGLICEFKVTPTEGNLTINGKDQVLGKFGIRIRPDLEARSYLVHARIEG